MAKCKAKTASGAPCRNNAKNDGDFCGAHSGNIGRPSKLILTPDVGLRIIEMVKAGNYAKVAAQAAGITERTFYNWIALGEEHIESAEQGDPLPESLQLYVDFLQSLKEAEAIGETLLVMDVLTRGTGWQAPMTVLERKYPQRWGRREHVDVNHSGAVKHTVGVDLPDGDAEDLHALADQLADRRGD